MKKILVIGSTVADIIVKLDHMPSRAEDVNVDSQESSLGGCAFNVSEIIRHHNVPYTLFSPVGSGIYGDYVHNQLADRGIKTPLDGFGIGDNGCCYCFVESDGERTFICHHGAEYLFKKEWFDALPSEYSYAYICGLEVEDQTGSVIVDFLEEHPEIQVCFAPGPRITHIDPALMERIFALKPIIHLNEDEVCRFTGCGTMTDDSDSDSSCSSAAETATIEIAARRLHKKTGNVVIVTHGSKGSYAFDVQTLHYAPPVPCEKVVDTIGAGDSHCGTCLAALASGSSLDEMLAQANHIASQVVGKRGAGLAVGCEATYRSEMPCDMLAAYRL